MAQPAASFETSRKLRGELEFARQPAIKIVRTEFGQFLNLVFEEVVRSSDDLVFDCNALLGFQF